MSMQRNFERFQSGFNNRGLWPSGAFVEAGRDLGMTLNGVLNYVWGGPSQAEAAERSSEQIGDDYHQEAMQRIAERRTRE